MAAPFARFRGPSASASPGQTPSCANCSAPLALGQTWCLECGTAAPDRLGRGPGLRSSLGVVGVTLLLVTGAVAAAYTALASKSRQATTQTTAQAVAQAPAIPDVAPSTIAPATGSAVPAPSSATPATAVPVAPKIPAATPTPAPAPATKPVVPKTTTTTTTPAKPKTKTPTTTTTGSGAPAPAAKSAKILLDTNAASSYDPYGQPLSSFGDPAQAIDGDPQTAWTYKLDPATAGKTLIGLAINLNSAQTVRSITIATPSPGMSVELYGATTPDAPVSISDPNWRHLATKGSLPAQATIKLKTGGHALRFLLVWITHAPPGATSVGISELSVSS